MVYYTICLECCTELFGRRRYKGLSLADLIGTLHWPTLLELNDEFGLYTPWRNESERQHLLHDDPPFSPTVMYQGPPPTPPQLNNDAL
jgi:hypothetical protein